MQQKFNSLPLPRNTLVSVGVWFFRYLALGAFSAIWRHNCVWWAVNTSPAAHLWETHWF